MPLEDDLRWFEGERARLAEAYFGKYLVIKDAKVQGSYDSPQAAYEAGLKEFGLLPFLVKRALPSDPVEHMPAVWLGTLRGAI
jgi:hypothetical protein